jgi:hypothetical protein
MAGRTSGYKSLSPNVSGWLASARRARSDLDQGVTFWTAALDGAEEETSEESRHIYRRIRLPDSEIRILLQKTSDRKISKERMHIDLETDDVEAEAERLEALGAVRWDHQKERAYDFWVLQDP